MMLMKSTILLTLFCFAIVGCESGGDLLVAERKVIRAVMEHTRTNKLSPIVINLRSFIGSRTIRDLIGEDSATKDTYRSYLLANDNPSDLPIGVDWKADTLLLDKAGYRNIFRHVSLEKSWSEFHQTYPNAKGIIAMSRVGFNSELDLAMVSYKFSCGPLCNTEWFYTLQKGSFGWKVETMENLWDS